MHVKARIGCIRRLTAHVPRGPVLRQVAFALVIGKLQSAAWITRPVLGIPESLGRITHNGYSLASTAVQTALNDLARVLLGVRRSDRIRVAELADKAGIPTANEIVIRGAAMAAWSAANGNNLRSLLVSPDSRTRAASASLLKEIAPSYAAQNMSMCWEASEELRAASGRNGAKAAARRLAFLHRIP